MIRFLDLKGQIIEDESICFAFFNTVDGKIMKFSGEQVFYSLDEFVEMYKEDVETDYQIERFLQLIPNDFI